MFNPPCSNNGAMPCLYRKYDQERVVHLPKREHFTWVGMGWKRQKICQLLIHNSTLAIILTNFHLFLERCAPLDIAKSTCLYLLRKTLQSVLETLGMFPLYFANSKISLTAHFLYFISCTNSYPHFFHCCCHSGLIPSHTFMP